MILTHVMSVPRRLRLRGTAAAVARWFAAVREVMAEVHEMRRVAGARYPFAED
jgi:hypothetical protein